MLTRQELHRLRGPAQLRVDEAEKMIANIRSFGILSGQPREIFSKPVSVFRDFVYLTETRRDEVADIGDHMKYDGPIHDWYNWNVGDSGPPIKTDDPEIEGPYEDVTQNDVILAIGVHYPATPSTEIYTANGRYRFGISDKHTDKELAEQLITLANTPRSQLKQTDAGWKYNDPNRYYLKTRTITDGGKDYEIGEGMWFEKSNGLLNEPAVFMESIEAAYDTNGHIFFIIGNPRVPQVNFNAINYKVIS
jgi:hypothetical protein